MAGHKTSLAVAYLYSVFATVAPGEFPPEMRDGHGMVGVYFEVAAVIITLVLLGEWLELRARGRTSAAIQQLLELAPKTARRLPADGANEEIPLDAITGGDRERVRPGEKIWAFTIKDLIFLFEKRSVVQRIAGVLVRIAFGFLSARRRSFPVSYEQDLDSVLRRFQRIRPDRILQRSYVFGPAWASF